MKKEKYRSLQKLTGSLTSILIAAVIITLTAPAYFTAYADDSNETITVRVGYYEKEYFEEGNSKDSVKTGYAYDYYRKISEYTGWRYEYVYDRYDELKDMLADGRIDLMAGIPYEEDAELRALYPDAPMGSDSYLIIKHEDDDSITTDLPSLRRKKIGVTEGAPEEILNEFLDAYKVDAKIVSFNDSEDLCDAFDEGSIDVMAAQREAAYDREGAELMYSYGASDYFLCVSPHRKDLLADLNTAQGRLVTDEPEYMDSLHIKYSSGGASRTALSKAEKEWLENHDKLRIGYLNHYMPYSGTDENGEVTGLIKDLIPGMKESLGDVKDLDQVWKGYDSFDDMIEALSDGEVDIVFPVGGGLYYSEINDMYQSGAVVSATTDLIFKGDYTEDTVSNFAVNENNRMQFYYIKSNFPDADISFYGSIDDCLNAVSNGAASCTTLNGLRSAEILKNSRYDSLNMMQLNEDDERCIGVNIGNEGLLRLVNRGLDAVGSEYPRNLAYQYLDSLHTYSASDFIKDHLILSSVIAVIVIVLILFFIMRRSFNTKRTAGNISSGRKEM